MQCVRPPSCSPVMETCGLENPVLTEFYLAFSPVAGGFTLPNCLKVAGGCFMHTLVAEIAGPSGFIGKVC